MNKGTAWTFTMNIPIHLHNIIKPGIDTINGEIVECINPDGSWISKYDAKTSSLRKALDIQSLEE